MDWISLSFVNGYAKILEKALLDTVIRIDLMISEEGENTMAKTKVICFTNNKGGSGKTTTCSNVGFGLRELGKKVLMIDGDMQLNLSLSLFDEPETDDMGNIVQEKFVKKWKADVQRVKNPVSYDKTVDAAIKDEFPNGEEEAALRKGILNKLDPDYVKLNEFAESVKQSYLKGYGKQ